MFCTHCGAPIQETWAVCGSCGKPLQKAVMPVAVAHLGEQVKASSRDAASALQALARDPVSGMVTSWQALGPGRAQAAGIALGAAFALAAAIGLTIGSRRLFGGFLGFYGGGAATFFKLFLAMLVPPAAIAACAYGIRRLLGSGPSFAADMFTAGAALAPLGVSLLLSGLLGGANFEVVALLLLFAFVYLVLMLYRGLTSIGGLSERLGPPAVPVLIALSAWLTKVIIAALF